MVRITSKRPGVALLQLMVILVVLLLLLGLLLPAIQQARIAAARMNSSNNLKQMMLAVHEFAATYQDKMPPSVGLWNLKGGTFFFHILPYIEQGPLYKAERTNAVVKTYLAPADPSVVPGDALISYASNISVFGDGTKLRRLDPMDIPKGTLNTIGLVERYAVVGGKDAHLWGDPKVGATYLDGVKSALEKGGPNEVKNTTAHAFYPSGANAAFLDGSVRFISINMKPATFQWACDPNSDQPAPPDF
jgi:prepilin-type processing-associated H-X9-DG protein